MDVVTDFIPEERIEYDRDDGAGEDHHADEQTFDRRVTIDHEDVLRRRFIGYLVSESLTDVLPDEEEQLNRRERTETQVRSPMYDLPLDTSD